MTLREELAHMVSGGQQLDGDELVRLADRYGIDPHEMSFLWESALEGKLNMMRGPGLDEEAP